MEWGYSTQYPFVTYRIEQVGGTTSIKFTREFRNQLTKNQDAAITRTEIMTLTRTGSWPTFNWTKTNWHTSGQTSLVEVYTEGGQSGNDRLETTHVRQPGN